jgi:UDP-glucose:(heptosyl)LPS alpha-1,3-glucosyltransferase
MSGALHYGIRLQRFEDRARMSEAVKVPARRGAGRLRIAFVVHDFNRSFGHGRYVVELATRFKRDHDVHVFANTFDAADTYGVTCHRVPAIRATAATTIASFILPATLGVRGHYDIVHAQGLCGLRQDVVTAHMCQPAWFDAVDRYVGRQNWRKRLFRAVVGRLERLAFRPAAAARFIAISDRIRDDLRRFYGLDERVRVIHHGVDTETFHPRNRAAWRGAVRRELGLSESDCVALYVGDLQKAGEPAIRAVARAPGVRLVMVSRTDPMPFVGLAKDLNTGDRVRFVPFDKAIERYYAAADLFLFPTLYDAFGMVVTEAMASGLPVVTSRAAGAAALIDHGVCGWLTAEPWNVDQLAEALTTLAADAELRGRMGQAARAAVERLTWDRVADETMAVYREVIADRR